MKRPVSLLLLIGACSVRAWFGSNDEWEFREEIEEQYDWVAIAAGCTAHKCAAERFRVVLEWLAQRQTQG